jgi:uncharacterized membrane protein YdfJ with MMPL/SSD domain
VATISVVLIAVVGSVTVLPALMSMLGDKVEFGCIPFLGRVRSPSGGSPIWNAVLAKVLARPGLSVALGGGVLLALAAPVLGLHTEMLSVEKVLPKSTPASAAVRAHHERLPGRAGPGRRRRQGP